MKKFGYVCVFVLMVCALAAPASRAFAAAAPAPGADTAGFEEFPIGDEQDVGPLHIAGVYFQPVDMEPAGAAGLPAAQSDMHLEADISASEGNDLGYGAGDFVPNLTVKYKAEKKSTGKVIEGNFMPMSASDGPHYGANVKLDGAGSYRITFIIENPEKQGYLLHVDKETGVPGRFWKEPIEVSWDFDFIPRVW
ncbi:MAG: iron transporter [Synergistaceae bacterium]|nr:iron transporter [Synergistaceae bacterium]